jgi:antitoxin (DNA-binding transcriptional repressor) of toxin-antitoxin stability system
MVKTIDLSITKIELHDLLDEIREGHEIILVEGGTPLARMKPVEQEGKRVLGLFPNSVWMSDDFNEPLPDDFWEGNDETAS